MSHKDIDEFLQQIGRGAVPSEDPLSALTQAHPHIKDSPKIAVIDPEATLNTIGLVLSNYEKR